MAPSGSQNGWQPSVSIKTTVGPIELNRPKLRAPDEEFSSQLFTHGAPADHGGCRRGDNSSAHQGRCDSLGRLRGETSCHEYCGTSLLHRLTTKLQSSIVPSWNFVPHSGGVEC